MFREGIPDECLEELKVMLEKDLQTDDPDLDTLLEVYFLNMASEIMVYIGEKGEFPEELLRTLLEVTVRRYNLTGQEVTSQDTAGSINSSYQLDPLRDFRKTLDRYISLRDSMRRLRML